MNAQMLTFKPASICKPSLTFLILLLLLSSPTLVIAEGNSITNIRLTPASPSALELKQRVNVSFDYETEEADGVRIFFRPLTGGYTAHGSSLYPVGSGQGTGWFYMPDEVTISQVRVTMISSDSVKLQEVLIPVFYRYVQPCDLNFVNFEEHAIRVAPTGIDDTHNIQCALNIATSEGYPVVKLAAGEYFTGAIIVNNFKGTLEGWRKSSTIINVLDEVIDCTAMADAGLVPSVFKFVNGEPRIRFMTIKAGHACAGEETRLQYLIHFTGEPAFTENCDNDIIFGVIDRVKLERLSFPAGPRIGVTASPEGAFFDTCKNTLLGTLKINRSTIVNFSIGVLTKMKAGAQVDINFNEFSGNRIAIVLLESNQNTTITTNTISGEATPERGFAGILVATQSADAPNKTRMVVDNNVFNIDANGRSAYAILVEEPFGFTVNVSSVVSNNSFNLSGDTGSGIVFAGVSNATVSANRFNGSGVLAVNAGGTATVTGWTITANKGLATFDSSSGADIILNASTSEFFIGANQGALINDMGSDNTVLPQF